LNFELCEPHGLLHAPHFGKLSEFAKVLSFGASRTGFYLSEWAVCTVSSSIGNAVRSQLDTFDRTAYKILVVLPKNHLAQR